jgi:hypothetical protein
MRGAVRGTWEKSGRGPINEQGLSPKAAATQQAVQEAWREVDRMLLAEAEDSLANEVHRFRRQFGSRTLTRTLDYELIR